MTRPAGEYLTHLSTFDVDFGGDPSPPPPFLVSFFFAPMPPLPHAGGQPCNVQNLEGAPRLRGEGTTVVYCSKFSVCTNNSEYSIRGTYNACQCPIWAPGPSLFLREKSFKDPGGLWFGFVSRRVCLYSPISPGRSKNNRFFVVENRIVRYK